MAITLDGTTGITVSGNITGNNISASGTLSVGSFSPSNLNVAGNVDGGNLNTTGQVVATGNITGGNLTTAGAVTGNGRALTSLNASNLDTGTVPSGVLSGSYTINIVGSATTAGTVTTAAQPNITSVGTLSSLTVSGNISSGNTSGTTATFTTFSGSGASLTDLNGSNISSGTIATARISGSYTGITGTGALNAGSITSGFGAIDIGTDAVTCGGIVNANANGVGNIGSSTTYFNTVFAKATSAQYADVAEFYRADADYPIGTVLEFGGNQEITQSTNSHTTAVAGTVSESPAVIMNSGLDHEHRTAVALLGRVPCRVVGSIQKGDRLAASHLPGVATVLDSTQYQPGCIIGKALENYDSDSEGIIEIVVGRL